MLNRIDYDRIYLRVRVNAKIITSNKIKLNISTVLV